VYQFASVTRPGRDTGLRAAGTSPVPVRLARAAAIGVGEGCFLLIIDVLAVAAVSYAAGSSWAALLIRAAAATIGLALAGLYRARLQFSVLDDLPRMLVTMGAVGAAWLTWPGGIGPAIAMVLAVVAGRVLGYRLVRRHRRHRPGRATIIVGTGHLALRLADALREDRTYGLAPVGFVGPRLLIRPSIPVLGPESRTTGPESPAAGLESPATGLEDAIIRYRPMHLIVAFPGIPDADLVSTLRRCRRQGVTVHVVPRLFELAVGCRGTELVRGIPLARMRPEPAQMRRWAVKRLVDVVGALIGLVLLSPVLALCALAVLWESGKHGVLFRQERIGRDGKPFTIMKFRSLTPSSATESQVKWNINTDVRLGPVGRLLRCSSLDELPQLLNVLRGEMSLVGPRPERPYFVEQFQRTYAGYPDRHRVPAGITGWAQIHGLRGDTSIEERVRFDNHYIEHWSLGLDVKIILRTVGSMISIHRA
jgi:exopolysaccharide biosynthesis polyprenyl glycosylphosphotransferase